MSEFKGTKGKWYAVDYTHFTNIQDEPYYEGLNLLSDDDVGVGVVKANALLMSKAPEMLEMLMECLTHFESLNEKSIMSNRLRNLIKKATEI